MESQAQEEGLWSVYGLINRAIEELVRSTGGDSAWEDVRTRAQLTVDHFEGMSSYDDAITYDLVAAAAEVLDLEPDDVLERFGRYWVIYTGAEGWGPILDCQGSTVLTVLSNLNDMHRRIQTSMPDLVMPTFEIAHADDHRIDVEYHSERAGLAPMVLGLLRGLAERFGEDWTVSQIGCRDADGHDTFLLAAPVRAAVSTVGEVST